MSTLGAAMEEAAEALIAFAGNPTAMKLWNELDQAATQAKILGHEELFEKLWAYEVERHKEIPCHAPSPKEVLQRMLKIA